MTSLSHEFMSSIKNAPQDIKSICTSLQVMSSVLCRIGGGDSQSEALLKPALEQCTVAVDEMKALADEFFIKSRSENKAVRSLNALRFVKKGDKIGKLKNRVQQAQATLILAQQISLRYVVFLCGYDATH